MIQDLKQETKRKIREIQRPLHQNVFQNFIGRIPTCQQSFGGSLRDILFLI